MSCVYVKKLGHLIGKELRETKSSLMNARDMYMWGTLATIVNMQGRVVPPCLTL